jgi:hypothetical protein
MHWDPYEPVREARRAYTEAIRQRAQTVAGSAEYRAATLRVGVRWWALQRAERRAHRLGTLARDLRATPR